MWIGFIAVFKMLRRFSCSCLELCHSFSSTSLIALFLKFVVNGPCIFLCTNSKTTRLFLSCAIFKLIRDKFVCLFVSRGELSGNVILK